MKTIRLNPVPQCSNSKILARMLGEDGAPLAPSTASAITLQVFDNRDDSTPVAVATLVVATALLAALQVDHRWTKDAYGYNFVHQITPAQVPERGKTYLFQFKFTLTDGTVIFPDPILVPTEAVYGQ